MIRRRLTASPAKRGARTRPARRRGRAPVVATDVVFVDPASIIPAAPRSRPAASRRRPRADTIAPKRSPRAAKVARTKRKLSSIRDNRYARSKGPGRTRTMV